MQHNDYELVFLAQSGNEEAINLIYQKYKPIIVKKSEHAILSATHHGIDISDIMQECFIALDEAIKNFNQDGDATFYTFAMLCIDRRIINFLRKSTSIKDKVLNDSITLDDYVEKVISDDSDLEKMLTGKDKETEIINETRKSLTVFEKKVFDLKLKDYTLEEIANILNKDIKSIYNTIQRIRIKIKKIMEIDN